MKGSLIAEKTEVKFIRPLKGQGLLVTFTNLKGADRNVD